MSESTWSPDYLLAEAKALAAVQQRPLAIEHFWQVADRDLAGPAPKDLGELVKRAKSYIRFDAAIVKHGIPGDPDIDSSIKRLKIYEDNVASFKTDEDVLIFFCKTNLLFLGREIFNKAFTFQTHARVCNFFVQKRPGALLNEQDETKERLLLYPRGSFKSTIDIIDCVQWIINFPDVRILVLTATVDLATAFIGELKNYFVVLAQGELTVFQQLFPQFTVPKK